MPPLAVIVAILAGSSVLGVVGALVAIPIAAALQIVLKEYFADKTLTSGTVLMPDDLPPPDAPAPADPPGGDPPPPPPLPPKAPSSSRRPKGKPKPAV